MSNIVENKIEKLLFNAIKSVLRDEPLVAEPLSEEELSSLYFLSGPQDVSHLVGHALQKACLLPKESTFYSKFQKQQMISMLRQERLDYELNQIRAVFSEAGIRFLPLKGSLIRSLYPEPWMRPSCDIDVLVDEENVDACISLLCDKLGYTTDGERHYHDVSLHSSSGVHFELHFSIMENMPEFDRELMRVWEFSSPISEGAMEYRMTNEFFLFHCITHMAYHFVRGGGCGIRPLIDLWLMQRHLPVDGEQLRVHLRACSLERFYDSVCELSEVWFGDRASNELFSAMQEFLLSGCVYGSIEHRLSIAQNKKGGKAKYLLGRIFLPYEDLIRKYPALKKHKILLPWYQLRRWCSVFFGGRIARSIREIRVNSQVSEESRDQTKDLLDRLGL